MTFEEWWLRQDEDTHRPAYEDCARNAWDAAERKTIEETLNILSHHFYGKRGILTTEQYDEAKKKGLIK